MSLWWAFWLISNFVNNAAVRLRFGADSSAGELLVAAYLDMFGSILTIAAAAFAISVVKEINNRQEERSKRVNYVGQAPPPPPLFHPPQVPEAKT
jgi:putative exporter of polyketide antibiotics